MYLTATSTTIAILEDNISHLWVTFDLVVGGMGIVMTVVILLVGWFQNRNTKALAQSEIEKLKMEIRNTLIKDTDEQFLKLKAITDDSIESLKRKTESDRCFMEGDIARSYAYLNQKENANAQAFYWWLKAAADYINSNTMGGKIIDMCVEKSEEALKKVDISNKSQIDELLEKFDTNGEYLTIIATRYKIRADIMKEVLTNKIKEAKSH